MNSDISIQPPDNLLTFYRIHGTFSFLFNLFGIFLICTNRRIIRLYKGFMINMQIWSMVADVEMTILMQPILLFPMIAGYTNGPLWYLFEIRSHYQMAIFLLLLYLQIASIVSAIVTKHQIIASIGNAAFRNKLFWVFVTIYHSVSFFIFLVFLQSSLTRQQIEQVVNEKYPNSLNILTLPNLDMYDMKMNSWIVVTTVLITIMLSSSITISIVFSILLFRTLHNKKVIISTRNYRAHKIAVTSLMAQSTIPVIVIIIPISVIVYFFIHSIPNSQNISNGMMAIYSLHSSLSTFVMIISTPHYRLVLLRGFKSSPSSPASQQNTKIWPNVTNRNKKLSEPQILMS